MLWIISSWSFIGSPIADVLPFMHKLHYCSKACVQWFTASAMNVSGRHLSCGHSESRSPDRPRFLLLQVAGPSAGRTGCPRGRHHGKCGFCGSFDSAKPAKAPLVLLPLWLQKSLSISTLESPETYRRRLCHIVFLSADFRTCPDAQQQASYHICSSAGYFYIYTNALGSWR